MNVNKSKLKREFQAIITLPGFGEPGLWLTFTLTGAPERLQQAVSRLAELKAVNLDDAAGGFLYPKLPVTREFSAIVTSIEHVLSIARICHVEAVGLDLDTSPNIAESLFRLLTNFDD